MAVNLCVRAAPILSGKIQQQNGVLQFLVIEKFLNTQPPVSVSSLTFPPHPETYILLKGKALAMEVTNDHYRFATALHHF
jgi:hypothetical protein